MMYESESQSEVSRSIIEREVSFLKVGITDNELCVVVDIGDEKGYYTADEARKLAKDIRCISDQRWNVDNDNLVEYIQDVADVVDSEKGCEEVEEKWNDRQVDPKL